MRVFGGVWVFKFFLNVFYGDQTFEVVGVVHHQQFLDAMLVQDLFRAFKRGAHRDSDEIVLRHHLTDRNVKSVLKAEIAVGENADQSLVLGDRHAGNFVFAHHLQSVGNLVIRAHGHRIDDHATLGTFYLVHLFGLLLYGQVAVNNAQATLLGQSDSHVGFGHCVHGGANNRNVEADVPRELGLSVGFGGDHVRPGRQQ